MLALSKAADEPWLWELIESIATAGGGQETGAGESTNNCLGPTGYAASEPSRCSMS